MVTRGAPLRDVLADLRAEGRPSLSFEFFPPRDDAGEAVLWESLRRVEALDPTFVSVTYGAGGSTRERTVRATREVSRETTMQPVAHLTCVSASRSELRRVVGEYADAGVSSVLALRGDPPGGPGTAFERHPGGLRNALELVELVRSLGDFTVGVAAFPTPHPESADADQDARVLALKARAGASFAVTQLFYEARLWTELVDRAAGHGCDIPVLPGLMAITSLRQVATFTKLAGAPVPARVVERLEEAERRGGAAEVRRTGVALTAELGAELLDAGAPGLHLYTLNRSSASLEIVRALGLRDPEHAGAPAAVAS
ncbi:methylenetetrahydrofolate reductase [Pseudokineococcus marinus]|uniref:Methylenetetrahydrofolate reductase n=1 Tax=Pseudokineococcus marinus TaxID=351215 RepID=A0A849BPU0_9ACTN|nr:methylenetetrahydrofolate reductase [Pseudokineococcus marinus]NNH23485.1 5,10-methylenetetrahydrofolate reductase [Pseudokineococcus marinus]